MRYARIRSAKPLMALLAALCVATIHPACAEEQAAKEGASAKTTNREQVAGKEGAAAATDGEGAGSTERLPPKQSEDATDAADKQADPKVDVYLFHGSYRCHSCNLMEELTAEAINGGLADEKKNGRVVFHHVNVEEDGNRHFVQDYRLSAISIILSRKIGGEEKQWKNLDQVWMLLRNREKFKEYVLTEIKDYLKR
jgi:protein-disulfide isomerase